MTNIVIGLGGMGGRIVEHVAEIKKEVDETIYAVLDTNAYEVESMIDSKRNIPTFLISKNMRIEEYIKLYSSLGVKDWMPLSPAVLHDNVHNGSGQYRYVSRLCFLDFLASGEIEKIGDLIDKVISDKNEDSFEITVVTSLAGGTGSGIFIQLALWLRKFFSQRRCGNMIKGVFILPDVFVRAFVNVCYSQVQVQQLYANTYAAIKELNAITKIKTAGLVLNNIELDGLFDGDADYNSGEPVYDSVYYVDAKHEEGAISISIGDCEKIVAQVIESRMSENFNNSRIRWYYSEKGIPSRNFDIFGEDRGIYRAYRNAVDKIIEPEEGKGYRAVLTPHLDKTWHLVLPEIITK